MRNIIQISEFQGEAVAAQLTMTAVPGSVSVDSRPSLVAQFDDLVSATNVLCAGTEGGQPTSLELAAMGQLSMSLFCVIQMQCLESLSLTSWSCTAPWRLLKLRTVV